MGQRVSATSELLNSRGQADYNHEVYAFDANGALVNFYLDTTKDNSTGLTLRAHRSNDAIVNRSTTLSTTAMVV